jgi:hypothetical protein
MLNPHVVYSVDDDTARCTTRLAVLQAGNQSAYPYVCTQQSQNVSKGKGVSVAESDEEAHNEAGYEDFDMGEAEFSVMEEFRRKEEMEIAELIEKMRKQREDPRMHCEGDTDIEDLFVADEDAALELKQHLKQHMQQLKQHMQQDLRQQQLEQHRKMHLQQLEARKGSCQ